MCSVCSQSGRLCQLSADLLPLSAYLLTWFIPPWYCVSLQSSLAWLPTIPWATPVEMQGKWSSFRDLNWMRLLTGAEFIATARRWSPNCSTHAYVWASAKANRWNGFKISTTLLSLPLHSSHTVAKLGPAELYCNLWTCSAVEPRLA